MVRFKPGLPYLTIGLACIFWLTGVLSGQAQGLHLESVGLRSGVTPIRDAQDMVLSEVAANWNLPWRWNVGGTNWFAQTRLDASAGCLQDHINQAAEGTVGPTLLLGRKNFPLSVEAGSGLTLLSRSNFERKNVGEPVQFTSHVGLNFDFCQHWRLSYRFQHMSNAGIDSANNPGLNSHLLGLSYLF